LILVRATEVIATTYWTPATFLFDHAAWPVALSRAANKMIMATRNRLSGSAREATFANAHC